MERTEWLGMKIKICPVCNKNRCEIIVASEWLGSDYKGNIPTIRDLTYICRECAKKKIGLDDERDIDLIYWMKNKR
jgi:hypothetical protein